MTTDKYYTPDWLADYLASKIPNSIHGPVLDPCAGEGALLAAVEKRFGSATTILAADLDPANIRYMKNLHPGWTVGHADAFNSQSRRASSPWKAASRLGVGAVVLNPPFSYRGGGGVLTSIGGFAGRLSPAAAVLGTVLEKTPPWYGAWALMPSGVMSNQRHRAFWDEVAKDWKVEIHEILQRNAFARVRARIAIVSVLPRSKRVMSSESRHQSNGASTGLRISGIGCICVDIIRGRVPRHTVDKCVERNTQFLHTTDLNTIGIRQTPIFGSADLETAGKFLVLRRVGKPEPFLLCDNLGVPYVLSDCLFAIRPLNPHIIDTVARSIRDRQQELVDLYGGTGAPHLTLQDLMVHLSRLGFNVRHAKASTPSVICTCSRAMRPAA